MDSIYGADPSQKVTPLIVRDAMANCFYKAHCEDASIGEVDEEVNKRYCAQIVRKAFEDTGGDFDQPTKESISKVMVYLQEFSKSFRDPEIIKKHAAQIAELITRL